MRVQSDFFEPYIKDYLENREAALDEEILRSMMERFMQVTHRQFMEVQQESKPSYPSGGATKCARMNALGVLGAPGDPIDAAGRIKFWLGDLVELGVLGLIQLAYKGTPHSIGLNNERMEILHGTKGHPHRQTHGGYVDGILNFNHEYHLERYGVDLRERHGHAKRKPDGKWPAWCEETEDVIVEFKSVSDFSVNGGKEGGFRQNGPDDAFGYLGQVTNYQRELKIYRYVFVYIWKDQAEILTHVGVFNQKIKEQIDKAHDLVYDCLERGELPPIPDVPGRWGFDTTKQGLKLRLNCRFCGKKTACMEKAGYELQEVPGKPFMGKPTNPNYFAVPKTRKPATDIDGMIGSLFPKEEKESQDRR